MKTKIEFLNAIKAGKTIILPFKSVRPFFEFLKLMEFGDAIISTVNEKGVTIKKIG